MIKNSVGMKCNLVNQSLKRMWQIAALMLIAAAAYSQAPTVNTPTVTSITPTGATLGGTVTGTLTHRGTRWSTTSPVGTSNELEEASTTAGAFTQARTGLPSGARIFFVAYARNNAAAGTTSETTFFTEPVQLTGGQFTAAAISESAIDLTFPTADSWEGTGATGGYVIFRKSGSAPSLGALADGAAPPADGVGDKIATITNGTLTVFNNTGLTAETQYFYTIVPFVWDGAAAATYNYNLTSPQSANDFTFSTTPDNHPSNGTFTVTGVSSTQINLAFDNPTGLGNSDGYIILRRQDGTDPTTANIQDGVDPATLAGLLPAGTTLAGTTTTTSFNDTGLTPATQYNYLVLPYNSNAGSNAETFNYKTGGTPVTPKNDFTFATQPGSHATGTITATPVSASQINLSFNSVTTSAISNATGYVVLVKSSAIVAADLTTLVDGAAPNAFGLFEAIINSTATNTYSDITGLAPNTTYHYAIIPFNRGSNDQTYNYLTTTGFATGSATTPFSQLSDIIFSDDGNPVSIPYRSYQGTSIANNQPAPPNPGASLSLGDFIIQDGGGASDADNVPTNVTSITIQITNHTNLRQIALFDDVADTEIPGTEVTVTGSTVTFTPSSSITVPDNGTFRINVRATFQATVTDKQTLQITITGATSNVSGSGFASGNAGGAVTPLANTKAISVVASRLVFTANPPATPINTNFSLTVRAIDQTGFGNLDLDYTGKVDLEASGGSGTLTAGAQSLSPNLVAGVFTWTQLQVNQADIYNLVATDDEYLDAPESQTNITNAIGNVTITSPPSTITQPATLNLCYGGVFKTLGNIVITETAPAGFSSSGSFSIGLPTGYIFDTSVTTAPVISNGTAAPTALSYTGNNIVQFSYNFTAGSSNTNAITISGLKIRYPLNTAPSGGGNITRVGGTAVIAGVVDGTVLGTVNATLGTPSGSVGFTVIKLNSGDVDVDPNETRFSSTGNAVRLVGTPTGVSFEFTGPGVTFTGGQYRFNPTSLAVGTGYTITYKVREGADQCEFTFSKDFEVYATNITNLATSYCSNADPSDPLSVSEAYIDSRFFDFVAAVPVYHYNFDGFVYFDPTFGYRELNPIVPPTVPGDPSTATYVFDPQLPEYANFSIYSNTELYYGTYGIWIGFRVKNPTNGVRYEFVLIPVRQAPTAAITSLTNTLFSTNSRFCSDNQPVTLVGSPANSSSAGLDFFTVDSAPQAGSVTFSAGTSTWSFNPAAVTGVTETNPVTFNMSYTFTDKVTNCQDTSPPVQIRVYARPASVQSSNILTFEDQQICPGTPVNTVTAQPVSGVEYKWYTDVFPLDPNPLAVGNSFTPPTDVLTPGLYEYNVTRSIGKETVILFGSPVIKFPGCESNRPNSPTPFNVSVTVKPIPSPPTIPNISREYCVNAGVPAPDLQVTGTSVKWYRNGNLVFTGASPTSSNLGINSSLAGDYTFSLTQTINGCEGVVQTTAPFTDRVSVKIKPLPDLSIISSSVPDLTKICTTGGILRFEGRDGAAAAPGGTWSGAGLSGVLTPNPLFGSVDVNPVNLAPNSYTLQYAYTNSSTGCSRTVPINFTILPAINVAVSMTSACLGTPITITNTSSMNGPGSIDSVLWDFDDNSGLPLGFFSTAVNANDGRTTGTYGAPLHRYTSVGNYQVSGMMMTNQGCRYTIPAQGVLVSPLPSIDFTWRNVCRDQTSGLSNTEFLADEKSSPKLPIASYNWDFNLNNNLTFASSGTGSNPTVAYNSNGRDSVRLIATTAAGCQDSVKKPVYIVPTYLKIMGDTSYNQNFNASPDFWIPGGTNSSWRWETFGIKGTEASATRGNGWDTNDLAGGKNFNNPNEQSWVLSQCFDFSKAKRPVIALDIFSDSPFQVNGAVLQYNLTGNIENDNDWITLGDESQGINWYDASGISNPPGNQSANDLGWTGNRSTTNQKYSSWVRAIHRLDVGSLNGAGKAVFRIAFAAGNSLSDGFAFDNVFIGERTRKVLVENFTNSGALPVAAHNQDYQDSGTPVEVVKVQYHTPFPADDPVNSLNPAMHNARTAFYGITESKTARIDGIVRQGDLNDLYEDRVLTPSPLKLTINPVKVDGVVEIEITVENISNQSVPTEDVHLFTTIVEQSITDPVLLSTSGNSEFVFVAKEMLPSPTGLQIPDDLAPGDSYTFPKIMWRKQDGDAIAVAIQSVEGNNKNVFQAELFLNPPQPDVVTGIEDLADYIQIFPNPANESFEIELPAKADQRMAINLIDPVGRAAQQLYFEKGEQTKTVNTQNLAQGIYVVQIGSGKTGVVRKKVMVVH